MASTPPTGGASSLELLRPGTALSSGDLERQVSLGCHTPPPPLSPPPLQATVDEMANLKSAFVVFDGNRDGFISSDDFLSVLQTMGGALRAGAASHPAAQATR
jgi:hypothetical protein